jgi:hypothetical protein
MILVLFTMEVGWPQRVGIQPWLISTHPLGVGASEHTNKVEPMGILEYSVIVTTLQAMGV